MIRLMLVLVILVLAFYGLRKFLTAPPKVISKIIKKTALFILLMGLIYLTVTGRLNGIFALLGLLFAFLIRILPYAVRYVPQIQTLWGVFNNAKHSRSKSNDPRSYSGKMSIEEAREILGVTSSASEQDIIMAHRKLIQKMHPDRGGSDYLAAKINQAKKVLLQK